MGTLWRLAALIWLLAGAFLRGQTRDAEIRAHREQAEKAQQQGDFQAAASGFQKLIELNPSDAEAHARLGMVFRRLGKGSEATESLERALRLDPKLPRLKVLLAFNYIDSGRCSDAIPLLTGSFEEEREAPIRTVVGQRLAECHLTTGGDERALEVVQQLRQIAPDSPDVLQLSLKVYMSLWNGAFQQLLAKAPASYQARQIVAEGLEAQERFAEAAAEYRQILKMQPQLPGMHYKLGRMLLRSETGAEADEKALVEFRKELEINSGHAAALAEIGDIHLRKSQLAEASRSFEQAVKLQPGYVPATVGLAKVLIAQKQWSKAVEHLEAAAKLAPKEETVHYNLMIAYRGLNRLADAKRAFETFQSLKQQNQQSRSLILKGLSPQ